MQAEGLNISVYPPPNAGTSASDYGNAVARIINSFSDQFGPLPNPNLTIVQIPDGTLPGYSAPGLLLLSQRQWGQAVNTRQLANLVAGQWWGNQVMAASPSDVWLTDGLSRYSEALYVEQSAGRDGMNKALNDFAIGALMYDNTSPIGEAGRLEPFSPNYTSVVVNKGAMVFHMLREQLGDSAFSSLLHDYYKQYSGKAASLADFEKIAQDHVVQAPAKPANFALGQYSASSSAAAADADQTAPANIQAFFAQWINSTGIPEFNITYTVFRTKTGFRIDGKIKQNLDFFRMPVEIEVQTEGNPEIRTVEVSGTDSSFSTEVFGRPKPGGIVLDPHNYILKSSQQLRVRAIIARGETFAEQGRYYDAIQQYQQALDQQKEQCPGGIPHGRSVLLPEELFSRGQRFSRLARRQYRSQFQVGRSLGPYLSGQGLRHCWRPRPCRQRIQQGAANQRQHRRRARRGQEIPGPALQGRRVSERRRAE